MLNRANVAKYRQAGLKKVEWSVGPEDGRECAVCAARGGKVYLIDEAPIIPAHPRCRCIYAGVVELSNEDVEVDGPAADAALEAAQQQKKLQKAAESGIIKTDDKLPKVLKGLPDEKTKAIAEVVLPNIHGVIPKGADIRSVVVMAGKGTSTTLRDTRRLSKIYPEYGDAADWQKKSGTVKTGNFNYEIHWYEANGKVPDGEIKVKGVK